MPQLVLDDVRKRFGAIHLFDGLKLCAEAGEFLAVVGPSGCGKSTLLRLIAGLDPLDGGTITLGKRRIDTLDPAKRGVAMVFQSYALYPQMNVRENIGFPLRIGARFIWRSGSRKATRSRARRHWVTS
ncbi:ATP-binding cassette domain-containing protein [Erythrobacter sp. LQ02-29]|uniref:ATP-binding cassette domain-containing protein n=1 Tax=Erythrobacter sp. LQ02-29 TaxID=2920384 RepID=UPI001F4D749F|nr:ATP-binding cassette domain-containing protein [Erythrobacter sp. LQ02-29]MCP9221161.1 ATP-binding cassette domain-containing protein [Erythrobacter sp. LQ02-29]